MALRHVFVMLPAGDGVSTELFTNFVSTLPWHVAQLYRYRIIAVCMMRIRLSFNVGGPACSHPVPEKCCSMPARGASLPAKEGPSSGGALGS